MTLPVHPNAISFVNLETEFGGQAGPPAPPATRMPISIGDYYSGGPYVSARTPGFPLGVSTPIPSSGALSMGRFHGAGQFRFSLFGGTNVDLRSAAINAGWNQIDHLIVANVGTIVSNSVGAYALTISGSFPRGVDFINEGLIVGRGGNGGVGGAAVPTDAGSQTGWANGINGNPAQAGSGAGPALIASVAVVITNNATIAGGGGGGGGGGNGASSYSRSSSGTAGGSGGGGIGNGTGAAAPAQVSAGSMVNFAGAGLNADTNFVGAGGAGGYTVSPFSGFFKLGGSGGAGGGYGSGGAGGGPWTGNPGPHAIQPPAGGGAAGAAIVGNGNITWVAFGNRFGGIV